MGHDRDSVSRNAVPCEYLKITALGGLISQLLAFKQKVRTGNLFQNL